ncbi:MAG: VOC family protein [Candidatus Bathyarchaeota archaeon]|nr:VOC family protein [Candidatus Bathyarchaeota archaeon]
MDKVLHFEIPVDNLERAKNFYKTAFNWLISPVPELQYTLLGTVEVDQMNMPKEAGAINGGMMQRSDKIKTPVLTIGVENIDDAIKKVESLGGKIVQGKMEVPNMGITAYFQDTEGNVLGLWQALRR